MYSSSEKQLGMYELEIQTSGDKDRGHTTPSNLVAEDGGLEGSLLGQS